MRAIIVDDEQHNIENLAGILAREFPDVRVVGVATNKKDAIEMIRLQQPDILFLDIQMGESNGFEILQGLSSRNFEVVFVTAFDQYGIQAIKYAALDYILKPIDNEELGKAIANAQDKIQLKRKNQQVDFLLSQLQTHQRPAKVALPQLNEVRYVAIADIIRCEAQNSYTWFFLLNEVKVLVSRPLKEYEGLLAEQGFIRCHQTHLINSAHVKSYLKEDGGTLLLQDGTKIPVSKTQKDKVKKALSK